jgi:GLPGLI family protein
MKNLLYYILFISLPFQLSAQAKFINEGKIEYERKINVYRQMEDESQDMSWFKDLMSRMPNFHSTIFSLDFKNERTIYKPVGEMVQIEMPWLIGPAKENVIYTDLDKKDRRSYKAVFEEKFAVTDSLKQSQWKITDEIRTIAGFECRKAVSVICDSVYVVAFYAEEIPVSGGPESFNGLPGMILGLVIPRLHTTWFATKIVLTEPTEKEFTTAIKGQRIDQNKLRTTLKSSLKSWGKYGERNIWWVML